MGKVLVLYDSASGNTAKMSELIAEGVRHATISLTADLYGKLGIDDLGEEV